MFMIRCARHVARLDVFRVFVDGVETHRELRFPIVRQVFEGVGIVLLLMIAKADECTFDSL